MRSRLRAWTLQVRRFIRELPPEERTTAPVIALQRQLRMLRLNIEFCTGQAREHSAVDVAWRRFKRAWDEAQLQLGPARSL
ncbi:MAG: hypothetical protein ACYTHK_13545 [Planctomycetota bacterium]